MSRILEAEMPDRYSQNMGPLFDGADINHRRDTKRLTGQIDRVYRCIAVGGWWSVAKIARATRAPEPSVSAQLRNLRKDRFGGHNIERRRTESGLYEYRLGS